MSRLVKVSRAAFTRAFQPLATASIFALWWFLPWREEFPLESAGVILVIANALIYALEHAVADVEDWTLTSTDRRIDAFYVAMRVIVIGPVFQIALLLTLEPYIEGILPVWPHDAPLAVRIALALVIGDLIPFVAHRAMHRFPYLWRYHATHHAQTKLSSARWSSGHPIEYVFMNLPVLIVIALLGPGFVDVAGALIIGRMTVVLAHSNLPLRTMKVYGWFLTTPEQHRRHHARTQRNANFGDAVIMFDRIFGSFQGDTTTDIGVGAANELTLREQLVLPWKMSVLQSAEVQDSTSISA